VGGLRAALPALAGLAQHPVAGQCPRLDALLMRDGGRVPLAGPACLAEAMGPWNR
jgi:hypothetical protein